MFNHHKVEIEWGGRPLILETGKIARQADGAVLATYGETVVLATVVSAKEPKPGFDFFPLTVNYQEKTFAAGKIPGGYFKREGRPSEKETLVSRLIDRPIRPLFAEGYKNDTQVVVTVLQHDLENDPDIVSIVATSAALTLSGVPFMGPIGGARVGYINGEYVLNPHIDEMQESKLDLVVAGTDDAVLMVEFGGQGTGRGRHARRRHVRPQGLPAGDRRDHQARRSRRQGAARLHAAETIRDLEADMLKLVEGDLRDAYKNVDKQKRYAAVDAVKAKVKEAFAPKGDETPLSGRPNRSAPCSRNSRPRSCAGTSSTPRRASTAATCRPSARSSRKSASCRAPTVRRCSPAARRRRWWSRRSAPARTSSTSTALTGMYKEKFLLHYNFPPYSVGETGRMGSPGRREIGHGKLAWRAIRPMLPAAEAFPYTLRVVSEITESNGSSSMATVCGTSLALMDAGVPLGKPVAGIAMGLIKEGERFAVLSDILGDEDHLGDMDFKVAGTDRRHHRAADGHQDRRASPRRS